MNKNRLLANNLSEQYLDNLYQDVHANKPANGTMATTQGEILTPSVTKLLAYLAPTPQDVFIDLGCSVGKIVLQCFLQTAVKAAYGIELVPSLHQQAEQASQQLRHDLPELFANNRTLQFICGNFLTTPFPTATLALVNPICFGQDLLYPLSRLIDNNPTIRAAASLRPLCDPQRLRCTKIIRLECSWDSALCYIYTH